ASLTAIPCSPRGRPCAAATWSCHRYGRRSQKPRGRGRAGGRPRSGRRLLPPAPRRHAAPIAFLRVRLAQSRNHLDSVAEGTCTIPRTEAAPKPRGSTQPSDLSTQEVVRVLGVFLKYT